MHPANDNLLPPAGLLITMALDVGRALVPYLAVNAPCAHERADVAFLANDMCIGACATLKEQLAAVDRQLGRGAGWRLLAFIEASIEASPPTIAEALETKANTHAAQRAFERRHGGQLVAALARPRRGYLDRPPTPGHPFR